MIKKKLAILALACGFTSAALAQDLSLINQEETTRIVRTLSADDMQGRATFTPGIDKAAAFIQHEFQKIGLQPLPGEDDFLQTFSMYRVKPVSAEVKINGKAVDAASVFALGDEEEVKWKRSSQREVIFVDENANLREVFRQVSEQDKEALVLVHPVHTEAFNAYHRYVSRGSVKKSLTGAKTKVFVLSRSSNPLRYRINLKNKVEKLQLTNVAGMIEGKRKDEMVVFSGHYDHIGTHKAIDGDTIANGADDDASGTTAMMMLARYYKQQPQPERTLLFVAFTAEEIGGFGSKHFSEQLNPDQIVAMFNIEMVGKPSKFGPNSAYLTGFERSSLGPLMQRQLEGSAYSIHPDPYPEQNLFYRSDNATLARLGVPAHTISSVQIDKDTTYHTVKDEFEMLDMAHLTNMIKAIAVASQGVVDGDSTPTRVDKALVK
ncbi:MAG: M20/M25/M40 family metallo-hydrolase [Hymenobacteraceae bacterium]|nr:M20/M25/M40 family metallo-hydrolase [Hymenobacteraceae bacterium]